MDRRQFLATLGIISSNTAGCARYMKDLLEEIEKERIDYMLSMFKMITDSYAIAKTTSKFLVNNSVEAEEKEGGGIILSSGHFITVDHNVSNYEGGNVKKIFEKTYINGSELETIVRDQERDIAVFELPKTLSHPSFPMDMLGDSDKIYIGQEVYLIGNPYMIGALTKKGIISRLTNAKIDCEDDGSQRKLVYKAYCDEDFGLSIPPIGGDSGYGVFDTKEFKLLGLVRYLRAYWDLAFVKKINTLKEFIKWNR